MGYVAIRHQHDVSTVISTLAIDDVTYLNGGNWTSLGTVEGGQYDFTGLTSGATYQARVRAKCQNGYYGYWTDPVSFTTPTNIVFADANVKSECVDSWDTNGDNELSYAEAAVVTDIETLFRNNSTITSFNELQYFTGLTSIASNAFAGCSSLAAVTLPNTITSIGQNAFGINSQGVGCTSLSSIVFPNSLTTIGFEAFYQSGLTEVSLPYSVTTIGALAFGDCNNLVAVSLPATVNQIEGNAFTGTSIASIEVDLGNPVYDSRNGCNAIIETATNKLITGCKNTVVPDGVTAIGISAFENCTGLTDITLPATVETIKGWAFLNCHGLTTIDVQATTPPTLEEYAFMNLNLADITVYVPCGSLETYEDSDWNAFNLMENCNIVFEDLLTKQLCLNAWDRNYDGELSYAEAATVTDLDQWFNGEESITRFNELQYFTGLDEIRYADFSGCTNLVAVTFPPTVTSIGNYAFDNCSSLASLTLGEHITNIGEYAFSDCGNLTFIKVDATEPPVLDDYAFIGVNVDIPVYVPCGTKNDYQSASGWNDFDNFIDMCDYIEFEDDAVKALCVANWDTNNDGELSYAEAAAVTDLGTVFQLNDDIQTFDELQYFTGLTEIGEEAFYGSLWLNAVTLPATVTSVGFVAFFNTNLTSVTLPASVQTIGAQAYGHCHELTLVAIPSSVTSIGLNPFVGCENLASITVDDDNPVYTDGGGNAIIAMPVAATGPIYTLITGCKNTVIPDYDIVIIGSYAFSWQTHLTSITLPGNVVELGDGAFEHCTSLTEIHVEATTPPTLGDYVFDGMNLYNTWLYVPCGTRNAYDDVEEGWGMFPYIIDPCANIYFYDSNVKAICVANWDTNGDGELSYTEAAEVESLGTVFQSNTTIISFDELQYFTGLTSIDANAFDGCTSLESVTFPASLTTIGNYAFQNCASLISVIIPSGVTSIGSNPFAGCSALESIVVESGNTVYDSRNDCNAIIKTNIRYLISGCKNTIVPDDTRVISTRAFYGCTGLTSLTIPSTVSSIGAYAFYGCSALASIDLSSVTSIDNYAFGYCSNMTSVVLGEGLTSISMAAFRNCSSLTSLTIPATVTTIKGFCFDGCTSLTSITSLAETPPTLTTSSFQNVPIDIPVYVPCGTVDAYQAASGWSSFTNIQENPDFICFADPNVKALCVAHWDTNGDGELSYSEAAAVTSLGTVFSNNTTIESFDELQYFTGLENGIYWNAFEYCTALESVTLPNNVKRLQNYSFNGCTSLTSIVIPESTLIINQYVFQGCTSLANVVLGSSLTEIGREAFRQCSALTSIVLPQSLTTIGQEAFFDCSGLQSITSLNPTPPTISYTAIGWEPTNIPLYVPCGSVAAYQAASGWGDYFTNIQGVNCPEVAQSFTLDEGWNWWTPTVRIVFENLETVLEGDAPLINTQDGGFARYDNGSWSGTMGNVFEPGQMYKIFFESDGTYQVIGTMVPTVTVTIKEGYNWFGYTGVTNVAIDEALGDFVPAEDDTIVDEDGNIATYIGGAWTSTTLTTLTRGKGYVYHSNDTATKTIIFVSPQE